MGSKLAQLQVYGFYCLLTCCVLGSASAQQKAGEATRTKDSLQSLGSAALRYAGPRWSLLYGSYEGVEEFAVNELQRMVQRNVPYVLEVLPANQTPIAARSLILVGTPATNPKIAELARRGLVKLPTQAQGYTLACLKSPWEPETRVVVVAGTDSLGVLYGVDGVQQETGHHVQPRKGICGKLFDALPEFSLTEAPVDREPGHLDMGLRHLRLQAILRQHGPPEDEQAGCLE